jgi:hypothetical protein
MVSLVMAMYKKKSEKWKVKSEKWKGLC